MTAQLDYLNVQQAPGRPPRSGWRFWSLVVLVGLTAAVVGFLALVQVRHWSVDEQQLHEVVQLIQQGRIQVAPPQGPTVAPAPPAAPPPAAEKPKT